MGLFKRSKSSDTSASLKGNTNYDGSVEQRRNGARNDSAPPAPRPANGQSQTKPVHQPQPSIPEIAIPPAPNPQDDPATYLRSIHAVRQQTQKVLKKAKKNELQHFKVDMTKFNDTANYVVSIIKRDYAPNFASIPPHGRWQHFDVGGTPRVDKLLASWTGVDQKEKCRRLLDLFLVSVLLDAGAGSQWGYKAQNGRIYKRSEGLAVASLEMFTSGLFSSDMSQPYRVDGTALKGLTVGHLQEGLQVSTHNPVVGLEGRTGLLVQLGHAMDDQSFFGQEGRPGNMLDYLLTHPSTHHDPKPIVPLPTLWSVIMDGLGPIWPATRTQIGGRSLGDAWPCAALQTNSSSTWDHIVPFHKLSQWLTYSLMPPMQKLMGIHFAGAELMTGLAEYRNGGLLMDTGLVLLRSEDAKRGLALYQQNAQIEGQPNTEVVPMFPPDDGVIIEWRAVTVGFLDELLPEVNKLLRLQGANKLNLPQMLEAGTWKAGREIAEIQRPITRGPPIGLLASDGTVF